MSTISSRPLLPSNANALAVAPSLDVTSTLWHRLLFVITMWSIGLAFFVSEHNVNISRAQDYTQNAEEMMETAGGGNMLRRLAFFGIAGLGLTLLVVGPSRPLAIRWPLALLITAFLGWCFLSLLWAWSPSMCIRRLLVLGCCVVGAVGVAKAFTMRELSQMAVMLTLASVTIGILAEVRLGTFRPWSGEYRFSGTVHPNTQGMYLAGLCLAAFGLARDGKSRAWFHWGVVLFGIAMILLTKSRTSALAVMVSIGVVLTIQTSLHFKIACGVLGSWLGGIALWMLLLQGIDPLTDFQEAIFLGRQEGSETFSGRFFIWPEVISFIQQRPLTGYGFESFWSPDHIETISSACGWGLREAHNAYLEIALGMGLIGLSLLLTAIGTAFWTAGSCYLRDKDSTYAFPLGMIVFGLINAGLESGMVVVMGMTFLLACSFVRMAMFGGHAEKARLQSLPLGRRLAGMKGNG